MVDFTTLKVAVQETSDFKHRNVDVTRVYSSYQNDILNIILLNSFFRMSIVQCVCLATAHFLRGTGINCRLL